MGNQCHFSARHAFGAVLLSLLTSAAGAQPAADSARDAAFEAAQASYERNHWPEAYAGFAALGQMVRRDGTYATGASALLPPASTRSKPA